MAVPIELRRDGQIAVLLVNRPEARNALDIDTANLAMSYATLLTVDNSVRVVVISGKGKAFCAGGDLKWVLSFPKGPAAAIHKLAGRAHQVVLEIRRMKKPVIAALNGVAAGAGFAIALACDFRVMARSAIMVQAYTSAGLCPDCGGTFTLPRIVGLSRALEIVAFDRPISSEQALAWGLATKVVDDEKVLEEAISMARELAECSLNSFGWVKRLLTDSFDTPFETHIEREREAIRSCAVHCEGQEGIRAFAEKRKPVFNNQ